MPSENDQDNQPAPPEATVPTTVPPAVNVGMPPSSTSLAAEDPNTDFRRKYDEIRGTLKAALSQWDTIYGELSTGIKTNSSVKQQLDALKQQNAALLAERETTKARLTELQELANKAQGLEAHNDKLQSVLRFPQIVSAAQQVEVDGEDGQKVQKTVNPLMDLALSSTLTGDQFVTLLQQLAGQIANPAAAPVTQTTPNNPAEMITTSPPPAGGNELETLQKQAMEAMDAGDYDLFYQLQDKIVGMKSHS